jgi:ribosome biogenesis GTPase
MEPLESYGWNSYPSHYKLNESNNLNPARVITIHGFKYFLVTDRGEIEAELSGKLLYGNESESLPKVGDWVFYADYHTMGYIIEVMPRVNVLSRKSPGTKTQKQILATNIDGAFIIQGLDHNFNLMRLERYLVQIIACDIKPIIVLNKVDLITDRKVYKDEVMRLQRDCPVYFCSTVTDEGLEQIITECFQPYRTYIMIGSSGVGKSSLLNAFLKEEVQSTGNTSESNKKGRHTTTTRDLFQLQNGSLIMDTPGMREFGVTSDDGNQSDELFPAIQKYVNECRFSDCSHTNEAGCAVLQALQTGELDSLLYDSYLKLIKEQRRFEIKLEDKKRINKQFGKMTKEAKDHRKKYKY